MKKCPTNHRNVERMSAVVADNLNAQGLTVMSEKALCKDCGAYVFRQRTVNPAGEWTDRQPQALGDREYACVALRRRSA